MKPEPMNQISISAAWSKVMNSTEGPLPLFEFAEAIIAARDAQWEQMLKKAQDLYTSKQPVQNSHEFVHVEGNSYGDGNVYRGVRSADSTIKTYDITGAEPPPPDSGFALLGGL